MPERTRRPPPSKAGLKRLQRWQGFSLPRMRPQNWPGFPSRGLEVDFFDQVSNAGATWDGGDCIEPQQRNPTPVSYFRIFLNRMDLYIDFARLGTALVTISSQVGERTNGHVD